MNLQEQLIHESAYAAGEDSVRLTWTSELPTVPGWYWCRLIQDRPVVVWIRKFPNGLYVIDRQVNPAPLDCYAQYHWSGPIPEPKEP